jgi:hypothetical protein
MEIGLTDHVWSLEKLVGLLEAKAGRSSSVKRFAVSVLKRLLISIAVLLSMIGLGFAYVSFFGPSGLAAACELTVAWPWALPQIFLIVCLIWFIGQRVKRSRST